MANKARWRGSVKLQERPDSPELVDSDAGLRQIRVWEGPYTACISNRPARFSGVAGSDANLLVDKTTVRRMPGDKGQLIVELTTSPQQGFAWDAEDNLPVLESDWVELQQRLEVHPFFDEITDEQWDKIEEWRNGTRAEKSAIIGSLIGQAKPLDFIAKLRKGVDSYVLYVPVARRTTRSKNRPNASAAGYKEFPPGELMIDGYEYLKTADRLIRQGGFWERVEEWTGAEAIDDDLYD